MQKHESNLKKILRKGCEKLQLNINEAKEKKLPQPREAIVLTRTESFVYFGTPEQREKAKNRWLKMVSQNMPSDQALMLKRSGQNYFISANQGSILQFGAELHVIHDMDELMVSPAAREEFKKKEAEKV